MKNYIFAVVIFFTFSNITVLLSQEKNAAKYWVFFKSKDKQVLQKASTSGLARQLDISSKALKRRAKVRSEENLIDTYDMPVDRRNIEALSNLGLKTVVQSKWLNAVSVYLTEPEFIAVKDLPFVKKIQLVAKGEIPPPSKNTQPGTLLKRNQENKLDYGNSFIQNDLINVPAVHDFGIAGDNVTIGVIDAGFKYTDHEAFKNLNLLDEHDFINDDEVTENESGQDRSDQHNHGTQTLSVIAGFKEGKLIGTAFNANILLAKTEYIPTETAAEEDYWVEGIEWMESQGADIVSSSLGYTTFDDVTYYDQSDMDGNTAVTTIAADIAAKKGVVVVVSAGNDGDSSWGIIAAPADADSVITVGAVTSGNNLAGFSSRGPTADGRIKPDVVAMGVSTYLAFPSTDANNSNYTFANGTSFACPAVAGVAGLILSAHPYLTPLQVRNALRSTSDNSISPDNNLGWGLVDAYDAILFHGPAFSSRPEIIKTDNTFDIKINADSKNGVNQNEVYFGYKRSEASIATENKMTPGSEPNVFEIAIPDSVLGDTFQYYFKLTDNTGITAYHPHNAPDSFFTYNSFPTSVGDDSPHPDVFQLAQNFPNPFNAGTRFLFELKVDAKTSIIIYNTLGQQIKVLENTPLQSGIYQNYTWDATDAKGVPVVSGVYFYELRAGKFSQVKKMLVLK